MTLTRRQRFRLFLGRAKVWAKANELNLVIVGLLLIPVMIALAFVPISLAITFSTAGDPGAGPALTTSEGLRGVFSAASAGSVVILMMGVLVMAGEFRHGTATSTFLISPDRSFQSTGFRPAARTRTRT